MTEEMRDFELEGMIFSVLQAHGLKGVSSMIDTAMAKAIAKAMVHMQGPHDATVAALSGD